MIMRMKENHVLKNPSKRPGDQELYIWIIIGAKQKENSEKTNVWLPEYMKKKMKITTILLLDNGLLFCFCYSTVYRNNTKEMGVWKSRWGTGRFIL
jgi:hypothetical protein